MPTRLERFTTFLLSNRWQTLLLVFAASFVPVLSLFGALVAALVTLVNGVVEGAALMFAATLPMFLSIFLAGNHDLTLPFMAWVVVGMAFACNVFTLALAGMLHRKASWSTGLQLTALVCVLVISIVHLAYPDVSDYWKMQLLASFEQAQAVSQQLKSVVTETAAPVPVLDEAVRNAINDVSLHATGLAMAGGLFHAVAQLIAARWWQVIVFRPGTLRRELRGIRLSKLAGGLFILSLVSLYYGNNSVISDIMPVLCFLFAVAGLSLIHYLFGFMRSPMVWFWLVFMYISILLTAPTSFWVVSMLGLVDVWMDIRKRVGKVHH